MQVLKCIHRFINTGSEQVCQRCGFVSTSQVQVLDTSHRYSYVSDYDWSTPIAKQFTRPQRYVDQKYLGTNLNHVLHTVSLFSKELGVSHPALQLDTIRLYRKPANSQLSKGVYLAITIAACMYISARRLNITITMSQLADVILKYKLAAKLPPTRTDDRRYIQKMIHGRVAKCVLTNDLYYKQPDSTRDIIALISQVGAQYHHKALITRRAIDLANEIISHDSNAFVGRKPAVVAAALVYVCYGGNKTKKDLEREFKVSGEIIRGNIIKVTSLIKTYGIKCPTVS